MLDAKVETAPERGACHCGAVSYEVALPVRPVAHACNCSICKATGFVGLIVPAENFKLLSGHQLLTEYRFNTGVARHWFCENCGVKSFYRPRSNPDCISVNIHCLPGEVADAIAIEPFDGQQWEKYAHTLKHLSGRQGD